MTLVQQLTTPETSRALIALGMPVPEPAQGQVWYLDFEPYFENSPALVTWVGDREILICIEESPDQFRRSRNEFILPAFTAPEIMAWAGERFVLWFDESPRINQYCACQTFDSVADSTAPFLHPNPAEAIAQAVIKAMKP